MAISTGFTEESFSEITDKLTKYIDEISTFCVTNKKEYDKGLDILKIKNQLLLRYNTNLLYLIYQKFGGKLNDEIVKKLIEDRIYLEKIFLLEQKAKPLIEERIKMEQNHTIPDSQNDLRPNLDDFLKESTTDEANDKAIYKPPKMMSVPYPDQHKSKLKSIPETDNDSDADSIESHVDDSNIYDESLSQNNPMLISNHDKMPMVMRKEIRKKKRAIRSGFLDELKEQYGDRPEEYKENSNYSKKMIQKEFEHRRQYEEDHMVRLNMTKKDKHKLKMLRNQSGALDDITDFRDYKNLMVQAAEEESRKANSRRRNVKYGGKKKSGAKSGKKGKHLGKKRRKF